MRFLRPLLPLVLLVASLFCGSGRLVGAGSAEKPTGRFLFQPQWLWANSETTLQGTGFLIEHGGKHYGVTSIHFLDFNAGGLTTATWTDIRDGQAVITFRASVGTPDRTSIERLSDVRHDYLLLVAPELKEETSSLHVEFVERYTAGTKVWFPNKNEDSSSGYDWIDGTLEEDAGNYLKVRLRDRVKIVSQSGSPILNAETGKVAGLVYSGEEAFGYVTLTLCPARALVRRLRMPPAPVPITRSIKSRS